ncbi:MAG: MBL fold metallo-hydrolase [Oscillospiraceae bacterium]|nr:MBL fold metallo-hydrolase [Oscillospiraceae bacterium]
MRRFINCIAHNSSDGNLLLGEDKAALFDCGMAFCAGETIQRVRDALQGRPLDFIFLTHTHYDHIGSLPFFKQEWPEARVVTSAAGAAVLLKDTPRRVIRELSAVAAKERNVELDLSYSDDAFQADVIVKEGDALPLGGLTVEVLETPGHTRDSLCFFIPELELLILNETPGVLMPDGTIYPCYLTGFHDTVRSIEKCRAKNAQTLSLPHRGLATKEEAGGFFGKALAANITCRDFVLSLNGLSEEEILETFFRRYASDVLMTYQPKEAFLANARATIACTFAEMPRL